MSTISPLSTSTATLSGASAATTTQSESTTRSTSGSSVDTRDTVRLSAEAQAILDKSGGGEDEISFVDSVRQVVDGSKAERTKLQSQAGALRAEARAAGEAPGEAMNERTGNQGDRSRSAAGRRIRHLVRR